MEIKVKDIIGENIITEDAILIANLLEDNTISEDEKKLLINITEITLSDRNRIILKL